MIALNLLERCERGSCHIKCCKFITAFYVATQNELSKHFYDHSDHKTTKPRRFQRVGYHGAIFIKSPFQAVIYLPFPFTGKSFVLYLSGHLRRDKLERILKEKSRVSRKKMLTFDRGCGSRETRESQSNGIRKSICKQCLVIMYGNN